LAWVPPPFLVNENRRLADTQACLSKPTRPTKKGTEPDTQQIAEPLSLPLCSDRLSGPFHLSPFIPAPARDSQHLV